MNLSEATAALHRHAGWTDASADGLLGWLRPYRGLNDDHLVEIAEAVYVLGMAFAGRADVDRLAVGAVWDICLSARCWTEDRHATVLRRKSFIPPEAKTKLDDWLLQYEVYTVRVLYGVPPHRFDWHLFTRYGLAARAAFAVPALILEVEECVGHGESDFAEDDEVPLCQLLGAVGPAAAAAAPALTRLGQATRFPAVRAAVAAAVAAIQPSQA